MDAKKVVPLSSIKLSTGSMTHFKTHGNQHIHCSNELEIRKQYKRRQTGCFSCCIPFKSIKCTPFSLSGHAGQYITKYQLTQDQLELYYDTFLEIDINYDGYIDYKQILSYYDILPSVYTEELITSLNYDIDTNFCFCDYLFFCINVIVMTFEEMQKLVFQMYDRDSNGTLDPIEFQQVANTLAPDSTEDKNLELLKEYDENQDNVISMDEFKVLCNKNPILMHQCLKLQRNMRSKPLSERFWSSYVSDTASQEIRT